MLTLPRAGWGTIGAAAAAAASFAVGGLLMTWKLSRHPAVSFRYESIVPDSKILNLCTRIAVPNAMQRFGTSLGYVCLASMINTLGPVSAAANTIANTVKPAFYIPGWGIQAAAAILAGNTCGARDEEKLHMLQQSIIPLETVLMMISGSLLFLGAEPLVSLLSSETDVRHLGTTVLQMAAISEPVFGIPTVLEGIMLGMGGLLCPLFSTSLPCGASEFWEPGSAFLF
ncbi:MAG: hypothetical protein HUJ54_00325 [Erysipelotrichaceae bacterium]|nr:hypothetical protein [Erysipelotrichaceae bacterium]